MTRQVCIYGRAESGVSCDDLQQLAKNGLVEHRRDDELDRTTVIWDHEELELITLPPEQTQHHIAQLRQYVSELPIGSDARWLLSAIDQFRLVQSVQYRTSNNGLDEDTDSFDALMGTEVIRQLVRHYQGALFVDDALYRESGELIAGPATASGRLLWDRLLDAPKLPELSRQEEARWRRTRSHLQRRNVPLPMDRLCGFGDEHTVRMRDGESVAQRLLVAASIVRGVERPAFELNWLKEQQLQHSVLPQEGRFFKTPTQKRDHREANWYSESVWTLLWALGHIRNFNWPGVLCEQATLDLWLEQLRDEPDKLLGQRQLRGVDEILDAIELINHLQWSVDQARRNEELLPRYLVWSDKADRQVPVTECLAAGIVEQRRRALNWLVEGQRWTS